jgi:hypothetical protein
VLTIACTLLVQQLMVIRGEFFFSRIRLEVGVAFPAPAHHRRCAAEHMKEWAE